ncbi:MAG: hypothetical protein KBT50_01165 [Cycloclasticus sp.]|nr:hypothetical protein [Cycloclasticus sp.]
MLDEALLDVLGHIDSSNKPIVINWDAARQWGDGVLDKLVELGLLVPTSSAQILECSGCEYHCFMDVITDTNSTKRTRAFIVCDVPEMQSEMGRIEIPLERLKQWRGGIKQLAKAIQSLLVMANDVNDGDGALIRLGMLQGKGGRRWVSLLNQPLVLEINGFKTPVNELLYVDGGELTIDRLRIDELVDAKPMIVGKAYTPSTDRLEARKLSTQAKYQDWQDAYLLLQTQHPTKPKSWMAGRIARMPVAQGRDSETIRKHLK